MTNTSRNNVSKGPKNNISNRHERAVTALQEHTTEIRADLDKLVDIMAAIEAGKLRLQSLKKDMAQRYNIDVASINDMLKTRWRDNHIEEIQKAECRMEFLAMATFISRPDNYFAEPEVQDYQERIFDQYADLLAGLPRARVMVAEREQPTVNELKNANRMSLVTSLPAVTNSISDATIIIPEKPENVQVTTNSKPTRTASEILMEMRAARETAA